MGKIQPLGADEEVIPIDKFGETFGGFSYAPGKGEPFSGPIVLAIQRYPGIKRNRVLVTYDVHTTVSWTEDGKSEKDVLSMYQKKFEHLRAEPTESKFKELFS
jgi:hypothetical protein